MLNKLRLWIRNRREEKFTKAFHHELENLNHIKMIEQAEHLASRPARTIANAPKVQINTVKKGGVNMRDGYRVILESENPDGFTCEVCQDAHKDEDSARECCDTVIYTCAVCDQTHNDEYDAENCCDSVRKGTGRIIRTYQCNWCHRKHLAEEPAEKCCSIRNYKCSGCGRKIHY